MSEPKSNADVGKRFAEVREMANLNKKEFAKALGVSPAYITYLELGKREPQDPILHIVCHRFGVNFQWLKHGIGSMQAELRQMAIGLVWSVPEHRLSSFIELTESFIKEVALPSSY